ncbi:E3 ubiquitin-protein ligase CSU1-like isoform X1 [Aristolochia californica]|uniref:E3 ubiquitin-protein ligase CSU1-like isoform X1 n=2 Tax=Aristolochia californica TaxID=171875 RepID=UPI0035E208ED
MTTLSLPILLFVNGDKMPQRHSKNNNDLAFFTYDEKRKLGYGTQRERLGKDSIKPFDACCLCLKPFIDPLCCHKGHIFCKECIFQCLLSQKKDIKRKQAARATQQKQEKEEEEEKLMLQKARELDAFDRQNHGAVPKYDDRSYTQDKNGFHGANSVKVTSFEEEALRNMKAFWLPSATPEAPVKVEAPSTDTICPEGKEKLKLKTLFPIHFTEDNNDKKAKSLDASYICPSCKVTLTNTLALVAVSTCGHVFCKKCGDRFIAKDNVCLVCNKECKERNLVCLEKGGTGYSGHGDHLDATDFKHLGSGSGLGLVRPAVKT